MATTEQALAGQARVRPARAPRVKPVGGGADVVRVRIRHDVKTEATAVLASMGLSVSDALRMVLTRVALDKALPVELVTPKATTIAAMRDAVAGRTVKAGSVDDLMAGLHEDD
ncbi:type II toxin-antitoxin system RelB/DinJ family antitoxin [Ralstonia thomasii]|uniref:type II toxin-antitoxin system RelB/DinJ family antitoxin n=1 Tax=Ralstonia thomasii TaxID=3058596 RepID=UPI003C2BCAAE